MSLIDTEDRSRGTTTGTEGLLRRLYKWLCAVGDARIGLAASIMRLRRLSISMHILVLSTIAIDSAVVITSLVSLVLRSADAGLDLIDSLPIGLYALPLMVLLPLVALAYHRTKTMVAPLFVFIPVTLVLGPMSSLVHTFVILMLLNLISLVWVLVTGRLPGGSDIRGAINRRSIAILLILNLIGLAFPVTTYAMGQLPIHIVPNNAVPEIYLTVETSSTSVWNTTAISPNATLVSQIEASGLGLELVVDATEPASWSLLEQWLGLINMTQIRYVITIDSKRSQLVSEHPVSLGTTSLFLSLFDRHADGLRTLAGILNSTGVNRLRGAVQFDLRLSEQEWSLFMEKTRSLDVGGLSSLFRTTIESINSSAIEEHLTQLVLDAHSIGLVCTVLIDASVFDDWFDGDYLFMGICGVTPYSLQLPDGVTLACSRTSYSAHMLGDVGEYLVYSYAQSIASAFTRGLMCSMRIGVAGNLNGSDGRSTVVYSDMSVLAADIAIVGGCGVRTISIESLNSLTTTFGSQAIESLMAMIYNMGPQSVNYTFRIFALRAVLMAIDMFDVMML